jgi:transglutaminase/protease-like cytokinesis protein 3
MFQYQKDIPDGLMKNYAQVTRINNTNDADQFIRQLAFFIASHSKSVFEMVKKAHDWVALHIKYDYKAYISNNIPAQDIASVLRKKEAVCAGYAELFKSLCDAMGIECIIISGYAKSNDSFFSIFGFKESNHSWNKVKVEGNWFLLDCTWDAGYILNNIWKKNYSTKYFFLNPVYFAHEHFPENKSDQLLALPIPKSIFLILPRHHSTPPANFINTVPNLSKISKKVSSRVNNEQEDIAPLIKCIVVILVCFGIILSIQHLTGNIAPPKANETITPQRDMNGLYPQDYDKNGWARLPDGKWVSNPNGKVVYADPVEPGMVVLIPEKSTTKSEQNISRYKIASDGYIHVNNKRYLPNRNYRDVQFLTGNLTLDNTAKSMKANSDYDTLLNIYKWITANIAYDTSYDMSDGDIDPAVTYNRRKGVCEDYSGLFAYFAEKNGIDVEYATSGTHAWNETVINDRRLYIDSTWGAGYVNGSAFIRQYKPAWFSYTRLADVEISERSTTGGAHNKIASAQVYIVD